jgi:hypothetical protein
MWRLLAAAVLLVPVMLGSACTPHPQPAYEERDQPVSIEDLRILDRADQLLASEANWNRKDTRECPSGASTLSLYCALHAACIEVIGTYDHRRPALQEVRFAIESVSGGREFEHRLMEFNNLPETTFADVKKVLALARANVASRLPKPND